MTLIPRWVRHGDDGRVRGAGRGVPLDRTSGGSTLHATGSAKAMAAHRKYVTEVQQLVDEQSEVLFSMVTAAAARASLGDQGIEVNREGRALRASVGARAVLFRIEAITERPEDLRLADAFMTGQARCILSRPDGTSDQWVLLLQRVGVGDAVPRHTWMYLIAKQPVSEAMVTSTLRSLLP